MEISCASPRCCLDKQVIWLQAHHKHNVLFSAQNLRKGCQYQVRFCKGFVMKNKKRHLEPIGHVWWRAFSVPFNVEESLLQSPDEDIPADDDEVSPEAILAKPLKSDELKALLADSERAKLMKKLSEANQQNRFLKRQLQTKEDALLKFKTDLASMEFEIQALLRLAEEIAKSGVPRGTRKINGKYIQSHLLFRLEDLHEKIKEKIEAVDAAKSKEISLCWSGMAESVQVMGSFDGWSQGEDLSPEYTGSFTRFSTTLLLRPGRYEIKFLVDGEWQLCPDLPVVGEGLMKNNLLIVE